MTGPSRQNPFGISPIAGKTPTPFSTQVAVTPWDDQPLDVPVPLPPFLKPPQLQPPQPVEIIPPALPSRSLQQRGRERAFEEQIARVPMDYGTLEPTHESTLK